MNLYIPSYLPCNSIRENELKEAIYINCNLDFIENIFLFQEKKSSLNIEHKKITNISFDKRPTFQDVINYSNILTSNINIICNADISLTDTFKSISINNNDFYCITRYDNNVLFYMAACSQDTWCWKDKCKIENANFYFGILGCDNTLANLAKKCGYIVSNPSKKYITNHHHMSNIREYNEDTRLPRKNYMTGLTPT